MSSFAFGCEFCHHSFKRVTGDLACRRTFQIERLPSWTCADERAEGGDYLCGPDARHFKPHARYAAAKDDAA